MQAILNILSSFIPCEHFDAAEGAAYQMTASSENDGAMLRSVGPLRKPWAEIDIAKTQRSDRADLGDLD
jgi:hypothetical protein